MSGGRRAAAFTAGGQQAAETNRAEVSKPPSGGNWARSAVESIGERLEEMRRDQVEAIVAGTLPLRIPAENISDEIGSDRLAPESDDGEDPSSWQSFVADIERRGQRVPLRVRPADPDWRPDPRNPSAVGEARFLLQSGRRRLRACRELGVVPLAFLSFVETPEARLDDLQERYFENVARKDLAPFEKLMSIGLIASEMGAIAQSRIADLVGVAPSMVSRGIAVLEHCEALQSKLSLATAGYREIDTALAELRTAEVSTSAEAQRSRARRAAAKASLPFSRRQIGANELSLKHARGGGFMLTLKATDLGEADMVRIADFIEALASEEG